jgi:hypothetical protein
MVSEFTPTELLLNLVEAKPVMAAAVAGSISALVLGFGASESVAFGASVALGTSLGDALLTAAGYQTKVQSYLGGSFGTYLDPVDFVGGAIGVTIINLSLGVRGQPLAVMAALSALGAGLAPKISNYVLSSSLNIVSSTTKTTHNTSMNSVFSVHEGAGGSSLK